MELRKVLQWDIWGSGMSVLVSILGAVVLGGWLELSAWVPFGVGVGLIPWVAFLAYAARQHPLRRWQVAIIAFGNLAWVLTAVVILIGFPDALSVAGSWIVGLFSAGVLALGTMQAMGLRRLA